jgi:hypothetical protein
MVRTFLMFAWLAVLSTHPVQAQASRPGAAQDSAKAKFAGTWEGSFESDHAPNGTVRLVLARDTEWKGTLEIVSNAHMPAAAIQNFEVSGNTITFTQDRAGSSCTASAQLEAGALKGQMSCGHGGISFVLRRTKP